MDVFVCFLLIQVGAKAMPVILEKFKHIAVIQRVSDNHWLVWFFHPTVLSSLHEYAIHVIVYSGAVIKAH